MKANRCNCLTHRTTSNLLVDIMLNPKSYNNDYLKAIVEPALYTGLKKNPEKFATIKTCCNTNDLCEIFDAGVMGQGVRTRRPIMKGTLLGCYVGVLRSQKEAVANHDWRYDYAYGLKTYYIDASAKTCMMAIVNHSSSNDNVNVEYEVHRDPVSGLTECHIAFYAKYDLMRTEELYIDYGEDYWKFAKKMGYKEYELNQKGQPIIKGEQIIWDEDTTTEEDSMEEYNWDDIDEDYCHSREKYWKVSMPDPKQRKITDFFQRGT